MSAEPVIVSELDRPLEGWDDAGRGAVTWRTLISGGLTASGGLTMGVAEVGPPPGGRARLHRHAQDEVYYVLAGEGAIRIGERERRLAPGDAVFIPGGAWHAAWGVGAAPLRLIYVFAADRFEDVVYEFEDDG